MTSDFNAKTQIQIFALSKNWKIDICTGAPLWKFVSSGGKHIWRQVRRVSLFGGEENPKEGRKDDKELLTNVQDEGK